MSMKESLVVLKITTLLKIGISLTTQFFKSLDQNSIPPPYSFSNYDLNKLKY